MMANVYVMDANILGDKMEQSYYVLKCGNDYISKSCDLGGCDPLLNSNRTRAMKFSLLVVAKAVLKLCYKNYLEYNFRIVKVVKKQKSYDKIHCPCNNSCCDKPVISIACWNCNTTCTCKDK